MKKLFLTAASIAAITIAAPAHAQITQGGAGGHTITIDATGEQQASAVLINQLGSVNEVDITQSGIGNHIVEVDQQGSQGVSTIEQGAFGNSATVFQFDLANNSEILQSGVEDGAVVSQEGNNNVSFVEQTLGESDTLVTQSGNDNLSEVLQSSRVATVNVEQIGNNNSSDVDQLFGTRAAFVGVAQTGNFNVSTVTQTSDGPGNPPFSFQTTAFVDQRGNYDQSTILQESAGAMASVTQSGAAAAGVDANVSDIFQDGVNSDPLEGHSATVTQSGLRNNSDIDQILAESTAEVTQGGGDDNQSVVVQGSRVTSATIVQSGNGNVSNSEQLFGTRESIVEVTQSGDFNGSDIIQFSGGLGTTPFSFETSATVTQLGQGDMSTISQSAAGATANVTQQALVLGNISTITQFDGNGDPSFGNSATVVQMGDLNISTVSQGGTNLTASVTQTGNVNTADITQTGDNNFASIEQTGDSHVFTITQSGGSSYTAVQSGAVANTLTITQ